MSTLTTVVLSVYALITTVIAVYTAGYAGLSAKIFLAESPHKTPGRVASFLLAAIVVVLGAIVWPLALLHEVYGLGRDRATRDSVSELMNALKQHLDGIRTPRDPRDPRDFGRDYSIGGRNRDVGAFSE